MKNISPYIKPRNNTVNAVMFDVIIALLPLIAVAYWAFGMLALKIIGTAILVACLTEFVFSILLLKKKTSVLDGSAIITALLLSFTLSPNTPLEIVAFGSFCAIIFGKILWGGLGKNKFNPALIGREFMAVFFASVMTSSSIWKTSEFVQNKVNDLFPGIKYVYLEGYLNGLIYKTSGALGEYSILAILLGGFYLILKNRISWHIPFALLSTFTALFWLIPDSDDYKFSLAGILLGTLFMATDMPSSPTTSQGKLYYGAMIGLTTFIFIAGSIRYEYLSYAILLLNAFSSKISIVFIPRVWEKIQTGK